VGIKKGQLHDSVRKNGMKIANLCLQMGQIIVNNLKGTCMGQGCKM